MAKFTILHLPTKMRTNERKVEEKFLLFFSFFLDPFNCRFSHESQFISMSEKLMSFFADIIHFFPPFLTPHALSQHLGDIAHNEEKRGTMKISRNLAKIECFCFLTWSYIPVLLSVVCPYPGLIHDDYFSQKNLLCAVAFLGENFDANFTYKHMSLCHLKDATFHFWPSCPYPVCTCPFLYIFNVSLDDFPPTLDNFQSIYLLLSMRKCITVPPTIEEWFSPFPVLNS